MSVRPVSTEILPGRLSAVSDLLPVARVSKWTARLSQKYLPVSTFLLFSGDSAVLVDTGVAVNRSILLDRLSESVAPFRQVSLAMTRREPDAVINLPSIAHRIRLDQVYCGGILNPLDFFESVDSASTEGHVNALASRSVTWIAPEEAISYGDGKLHMLRTPMSVLPKNHLYDEGTCTLFGSDSWSFVGQDGMGALEILTSDDARLSSETIARHLKRRFPWMCGGDPSAVEESIHDLQKRFRIDRICSGFGAVIEGPDLVRLVLERTCVAVRMLSREAFIDKYAEFKAAGELARQFA